MDGEAKLTHVLRPHHLNLCVIMHCAFGPKATPPAGGRVPQLSPGLQLHVYRVLLREVAEVVEPMAYAPLLAELESSPHVAEEDGAMFIMAVKQLTQTEGIDHLNQLVRVFDLSMLPRGSEESEDTLLKFPVARRSMFGYFLRRSILSFSKLSFVGAAQFEKDFVAWRKGNARAGYQPRRAEQLDDNGLIFKLKNDKRSPVQTEPYAAHQEGWIAGDEVKAADSLRAYFEQHFHDGLDSGYRQHAMLQHSRMHFQRGEYAETRRLLQEAIALCRTKNDKETLMHCMSLMHLLPTTVAGQRPVLNEVQPELHPLSVLDDAGKLLEENAEQPLSIVFQKITEAIGLYDHYCEIQQHLPVEDDQWSQHLVQSHVWDAAGRTRLGDLERAIFLTFSQNSREHGTRMTALCYQAYELGRQGQYNTALALLLDPETWRRINFVDYAIWATEVWHILVLKASRRGMHRLYREVLMPRRPCPAFTGREYWFDAPGSRQTPIANRFFDVLYMRRHEHSFAAMESLLTGLWRSEYQSRYGLYRTGIALLADVGLEFGMSTRSRTILEEIMPQIHFSRDPEQRAFAFFTMARCIIVAASSTPDALREAVPWLQAAEAEYAKLGIASSMADVQYFLSIVHHNLGNHLERDVAAKRNIESEKLVDKLSSVVIEDEALDVWKLVTDIGSALALRF